MKTAIVQASDMSDPLPGSNFTDWRARKQPRIARDIRLEKIALSRKRCMKCLANLDKEEASLLERKKKS